MHFSIPETEAIRTTESSYHVYKLFINGKYHASLRYSQFLNLHDKLGTEDKYLPTFPPKKIFPLSAQQLDERRVALEKYMQALGGHEIVISSNTFQSFLRHVQHETWGQPLSVKSINVYLPNGQRVTVEIPTNGPTSTLLRLICEQLELEPNLHQYFGLWLFRREPGGCWRVIGKLGEFECPVISLAHLTPSPNDTIRIILRSWETDPSPLLDCPIGLHLLYIQTTADIEQGWIHPDKDQLHSLASFQARGGKTLEYLQLARKCKYFGTIQFPDSSVNDQIMTVVLGNRELILVNGSEERRFRLTRIKSWRTTLSHEPDGSITSSLTFEYLASKDQLDWLTIVSSEAVVIGICMQEIVYDMARDESGVKQAKASTSPRSGGLSHQSSLNGSPVSADSANFSSSDSSSLPSSRRSSYELILGRGKRLASSARKSTTASTSNGNFMENSTVFAGIGDEDL